MQVGGAMRSVLFQICAAAMITAVLKALLPSEKCSRQIKILISCYFIVIVITGFSSQPFLEDIFSDFSIDTEYYDYSVSLERHTADETALLLRQRLGEKLNDGGIYPEKIYIDVNIADSSSISISEIRLVLKNLNEEIKAKAVRIIRSYVGTQAKITIEEQ